MKTLVKLAIMLAMLAIIGVSYVAYRASIPIKEVNVTGEVYLICNDPVWITFYHNKSIYTAKVENHTFWIILLNNEYYNITEQCESGKIFSFYSFFNNPIFIESKSKTYFINLTVKTIYSS
ncbi:MAG: hypothetical protein ACP5I6_04995 [Caldisphaera sp.]|nr:hypothetical protein [Caldisphaera sp.]